MRERIGKVVIAWRMDDDSSWETPVGETDIYYHLYENGSWGAQMRLTDDAQRDESVRAAVTSNGDVHLAWLKDDPGTEGDESLMVTKNFADPNVLQSGADALGLSDLKMTAGPGRNVILLWQESFGLGSDGQYAVYDDPSGSWSPPTFLWNDDDAERAADLAWDSVGNLLVAHQKERLVSTTQALTAEDEDGGTVQLTLDGVTETAGVDLKVTKKKLVRNLTICDGDFELVGGSWQSGNSLTFDVKLTNNGDLPVASTSVAIYTRLNGIVDILEASVDVTDLAAGESRDLQFAWAVPSEQRVEVVVKADPSNVVTESDETAEDNEQVIEGGGTDLVLALKSKDYYPAQRTARIITSVQNAGSLESPASTLRITRSDGTEISATAVPPIAPSDTIDVAVDLPQGFQPTVFAKYVVEIDPFTVSDIDPSNNHTGFPIYDFVDLDTDRMDDRWEQANNAFDPDADGDDDGCDNLTEFLAGTDPNNPGSRFDYGFTSTLDGNGDEVVLRWKGLLGQEYFIESSFDLDVWNMIPGTETIADTTEMEIGILLGEPLQRVFFRVTPKLD